MKAFSFDDDLDLFERVPLSKVEIVWPGADDEDLLFLPVTRVTLVGLELLKVGIRMRHSGDDPTTPWPWVYDPQVNLVGQGIIMVVPTGKGIVCIKGKVIDISFDDDSVFILPTESMKNIALVPDDFFNRGPISEPIE